MRIKLLAGYENLWSRREYTVYYDLMLANILSCNVCTENAPIYQVITLN